MLLAITCEGVRKGYNEYGQCNVTDWTDIIAVSAGGRQTVGLKSDGTVAAVGRNDYGQCNFYDWSCLFVN